MHCKRHRVKSQESNPVRLPNNWIKIQLFLKFQVLSEIVAGPSFFKKSEKACIVIYNYAVYRPVHLELISSFSSDAFLLSSRRFIARRVTPRGIYVDNCANFGSVNN